MITKIGEYKILKYSSILIGFGLPKKTANEIKYIIAP
jgi:hypothetical protein